MFGWFRKKKDPRVEFVRQFVGRVLLNRWRAPTGEKVGDRIFSLNIRLWEAILHALPPDSPLKEEDIDKVMRTLGEEMTGEKH